MTKGAYSDKSMGRRARLIAIVDDDYRVLESLDDLLQSAGYGTILHSAAEEFLQSPERKDVDALISDVGLPGMSGLELLRKLQRDSQAPPTILITGRGEAHLEQDARALGVLRLFAKPFDTAELLATLEREFSS
jgi:FixJ family two-component response regulator